MVLEYQLGFRPGVEHDLDDEYWQAIERFADRDVSLSLNPLGSTIVHDQVMWDWPCETIELNTYTTLQPSLVSKLILLLSTRVRVILIGVIPDSQNTLYILRKPHTRLRVRRAGAIRARRHVHTHGSRRSSSLAIARRCLILRDEFLPDVRAFNHNGKLRQGN